jgi:hypothetical protein
VPLNWPELSDFPTLSRDDVHVWALPLDEIETLTHENDGGRVTVPARASLPAVRCWLQDVCPCRDYVAAVATLEPRQTPVGFTYSL